MASSEYIYSSNHLPNSCTTRAHTHTRRAFSKAQMCLFNILHIISSIPPSANSKPEACSRPEDGSSPSDAKGIGIDLNTRLCSVADSGESESFGDNGSDSSAIQGKRGGGVGAGPEEVRDKSVEISEATDAQVLSFKVDNNGGVDHVEEAKSEEEISVVESEQDGGGMETVPFAGKRHEGTKDSSYNCLDLLIEAARLISAEDESNSEEPSGDRELSPELRSGSGSGSVQEEIKKRKQRWVVVDLCSEMEETSPVVKSKRGRSQALPYRFRDSVVEPFNFKRSARPRPRPHRPSTIAARKRLIGS